MNTTFTRPDGPDNPNIPRVIKGRCFGYPYTNDVWNIENVLTLQGHEWGEARSEMAALAVGSGMLPYLFGVLPSSFTKAVTLDQHPAVHTEMQRRLATLQHSSDLGEFQAEMCRNIPGYQPGVMAGIDLLHKELRALNRVAGALGIASANGFHSLQSRLRDTEHVSIQASIPEASEPVREELSGMPIGFANVTNVANYLMSSSKPEHYHSGRSVVCSFLYATGVVDSTLIASCSWGDHTIGIVTYPEYAYLASTDKE